MLSPLSYSQSNGQSDSTGVRQGAAQPQHGHHLRDRTSIPYPPYQTRVGHSRNGVLPTPDPTVASCISDEDVARTLIALGDASNYSHGRTSNSTMDETFSGAADAASSTGATSDSEEYSEDESGALVSKPRQIPHAGDTEYEHDGLIKSEFEEHEGAPRTKKVKTKMHDGPSLLHRSKSSPHGKNSKSHKLKVAKSGLIKTISAPLAPAEARQASSSSSLSLQMAADEEDLSSKPRCQRCRKSKKGCDRQRPCGRCKDAGIGIEGCVSEDEGNGRKGRYGRHMGVVVKKSSVDGMLVEEDVAMPPPVGTFGSPDANKKRKR